MDERRQAQAELMMETDSRATKARAGGLAKSDGGDERSKRRSVFKKRSR